MPGRPAPNTVCPPVPEPSIVPSSASTESVMLLGAMTVPPVMVTPGVVSALVSNVSRYVVPRLIDAANGLSLRLR